MKLNININNENININEKINNQPINNQRMNENDQNIELLQYPIQLDNLCLFRRLIQTEYDCVINALQIIGLIDDTTSQLLRISSAGQQTGFTQDQIGKIFTLYTKQQCKFLGPESWDNFKKELTDKLKPQHVTIVGEIKDNIKHVFLIANINSKFIYIDPHIKDYAFCGLDEDPNCLNLIQDKDGYYLLFKNLDKTFTNDELSKYLSNYKNIEYGECNLKSYFPSVYPEKKQKRTYNQSRKRRYWMVNGGKSKKYKSKQKHFRKTRRHLN